MPERVKCLVEYVFNTEWGFHETKGATTDHNGRGHAGVCVAVIRDGAGLLLVLPKTHNTSQNGLSWVLRC